MNFYHPDFHSKYQPKNKEEAQFYICDASGLKYAFAAIGREVENTPAKGQHILEQIRHCSVAVRVAFSHGWTPKPLPRSFSDHVS